MEDMNHIDAVYQAYFHYNSLAKDNVKYAIPIARGLKQAIEQLKKTEKFKKQFFIEEEKKNNGKLEF